MVAAIIKCLVLSFLMIQSKFQRSLHNLEIFKNNSGRIFFRFGSIFEVKRS